MLGEAEQACRKVAGYVEQQDVGICGADDYLPWHETALLPVDGKESLAADAVEDGCVLHLVGVLYKLLQRRLCGCKSLLW